jgi:hypothetical protein
MPEDSISFHGAYDRCEYAALFGPLKVAQYGNTRLLYCSDDGEVFSGPGASFGGIGFDVGYVSRPRLRTIVDMLDGISQAVLDQEPQHQSLTLRLAPDPYYPPLFIATLRSALTICGWSPLGEVSYVIPSSPWQVRDSTARNSRKAERRGAQVVQLEADVCFDLLWAVKRRKGYSFGYDRSRLIAQVTQFPRDFQCYGVVLEDELVAALIEARIGAGALLVAWDQTEQGKVNSAVDHLLLQRISCLFAAEREFVDLGTVTTAQTPNWGLIRHKENFGGHPVLRNTYVKPRH